MGERPQDQVFATRETFLPFARPSITDDDVADVAAAIRDVLEGGR